MQRAFRLIGLAAIYTAGFLVVELFGALHPYAWTYSAVPAALVCAWPYFKLCQRYPMPGVAMLSGVMLLLISFIIGQGHEFLVLGCFGFGMIAEGLRKLFGNCRGRWGVITSYTVLSLIPFSKTCVLWIDFETAMNMFMSKYRELYYATMGRMLSRTMLITMIILTVVIAFSIMWLLTRDWRPREDYHFDFDTNDE